MDADIARLMPYVCTRSTNRKRGRPVPLEPSSVELLSRAVEREGARLSWWRSFPPRGWGGPSRRADRLRYLIPEVHQHMLDELRWPGRDQLDEGLDVRTLELDAVGWRRLTYSRERTSWVISPSGA